MTADRHDPGGKVSLAMQGGTRGSAEFSLCGRYRQVLTRTWDAELTTVPGVALWIGMNPSMADASVDDPTVRFEVNYTRNILNLAGYAKANVMDLRVTDPARLLMFGVPPRSADNLSIILREARRAATVIVAFGALPPNLRRYGDEAVAALQGAGIKLWCRGYTHDGSPKHGRGVRRDAPLVPYPRGAT